MKKILFCIGILWLSSMLFAAHTDYVVGVSGGYDLSLKYWDIQNSTCLKTMTGHTSAVYTVAMSPDAKYALSGGGVYDNMVKYWGLSDGSCIRTLTGHSGQVFSVAISKDGQYGLSGSWDYTLKYWKLSDGSCVRTMTHGNPVFAIAISPDGQYALSGSNQVLKYWRISDGTLLWSINAHSDYVIALAFSPDGQYAISGSDDKTVKYWRLSDGAYLRTMSGHTNKITSVSMSPDGQYALSGSIDSSMKYWRLSDGVCLRTISYTSWFNSVAFSPDGQYALSGHTDKNVKYWKLSDGTCVKTMTGHTEQILGVATGAAYLDVSYPNGGETLFTGDTKRITWTSNGTVDSVRVDYTTDNGSNWVKISKIANTGHQDWLIPNSPSTQCKIRLTGYNGTYELCSDQSDANFTIAQTKITVTSPNGGESWEGNTHHNITWTATANIDSVKLVYSTNSGDVWATIARVVNNGTYNWTVPNTPSTHCLVLIVGINRSDISDQSDAEFTIFKSTGFSAGNGSRSLPIAFTAAPSPFKSELRLSLPEKAVIYDMSGKRIVSFEKGFYNINTSFYQAGIYIIQCGSKTKRLVKID